MKILISLLFLMLATAPCVADPDRSKPPRWQESERPISLDNAVSRTRNRYGGRVLSAKERQSQKGPSEYQIRMLTQDGKVKRYRVDPRSGEYIQNPRKHRR